MEIKNAVFVKSSSNNRQLPPEEYPEYAFVGRSNVGKSSLINMLCGRRQLAKTSGTPGKTQLINHFLINDAWYLVDLPGYGYARVSKTKRHGFTRLITDYLEKRQSLINTFVLIDLRIPPQAIDLEFIEYLGTKGLPFTLVFTKADKLNPTQQQSNRVTYEATLHQVWESLPPMILTSAKSKVGKEEVLDAIDEMNALWKG